jgi:uroporphyrinogen decarboxylase
VPAASKLTPRRRILNLIEGQPVDRTPFCPAIYEHKAALIGVRPSEMCRDADLFERAIIREVEVYEPDMIAVGCDVYNVEAEAAGGQVLFPDSNDVPAVVGRVIRPGDDISRLRLPDPLRSGRMPLHLEVGRRIQSRFGRQRIVRGALSAPFSMACELAGPEEILMAALDRPDWLGRLLAFCAETARSYGRAFAAQGLGVILFDSHASPPLTSPDIYRRLILGPTAEVVRFFRRELELPLVPYIMGGDTGPLLEEILKTGTNNILCDYRADLGTFLERLKDEPVLLRANLDPLFLRTRSKTEIRAEVCEVLGLGRRHPRFIMGTGILPYDIAPENVVAVREALETAEMD